MDYGEIVKTAFKVSWRNKSLWILGLFAAGFSGFSNEFNIPFKDQMDNFEFQILDYTINFKEFAESNIWILVAIISLLLIYFLLFFILHCICTPALIDAVNRLTRGGTYRLWNSFSNGIGFFWRYLGMMILIFMAGIVGLGILIGPIILFFIINTVIGILSLFIFIPFFIFFIIAITTVSTLAKRSMVIRNIGIIDALTEGWNLFWKNKIHSLIIFLLYIALTIGISLGLLAVFGIMSIPFIFIASASTTGLILALIIGLPVLMVTMLPVSGFIGAAFESMYTIFYIRLVEPPVNTNNMVQPTI